MILCICIKILFTFLICVGNSVYYTLYTYSLYTNNTIHYYTRYVNTFVILKLNFGKITDIGYRKQYRYVSIFRIIINRCIKCVE